MSQIVQLVLQILTNTKMEALRVSSAPRVVHLPLVLNLVSASEKIELSKLLMGIVFVNLVMNLLIVIYKSRRLTMGSTIANQSFILSAFPLKCGYSMGHVRLTPIVIIFVVLKEERFLLPLGRVFVIM
jgi:hypothetical protein